MDLFSIKQISHPLYWHKKNNALHCYATAVFNLFFKNVTPSCTTSGIATLIIEITNDPTMIEPIP